MKSPHFGGLYRYVQVRVKSGCRICTLFEAHDDLEDGPIQLIDEFYFTLVTVAKGRKVPLFGQALADHQRRRAAKAAKKAAREERHAPG